MTQGRGAALAASVAVLLFAGVALASGLDRYSAHVPSIVRLVPEAFRVDGARSRAAAALAAGDVDAARTAASIAIRRDPLDPRGPAFLAAALQLSGESARAEQGFRQSAALGWREPLTQAYWFARALGQGNPKAAALRLDALLRAHPDSVPAQNYLGLLEANPAGRRALVERLRGDTRWAGTYLSAFEAEDGVLRARARFVADEAGSGLRFGCERTLPMVRELARRQYRAEADLLLAAQCPAEFETTVLADTGFERFGDVIPSGMGWRRHGSGDVRITPVGGDDRGIELANRSGVTRLVLSQPVALSPGAYFVRARIGGGAGERLLASLDCGKPVRPAQRSGSMSTTGIAISSRDCPNQIFGLWLRPGAGAVTINAIAITPS